MTTAARRPLVRDTGTPATALGLPLSRQCLVVYGAAFLLVAYVAARGWLWWAPLAFVALLAAIEVAHQLSWRLDGQRAKVVNCYEFYNRCLRWNELFPGYPDLTEGQWDDDPGRDFDAAHRTKIEWLLDQAEVAPGLRVLDVGCGNGSLLAGVAEREGAGVGITLSPDQVRTCRARGLHAELRSFWELDGSWDGAFDAIVFNGSIEHFHDGMPGRAQEQLYARLFARCARLLDPRSPVRKVVVTCIHLRRDAGYRPLDWLHLYLLERVYGGCYPRGRDALVRPAEAHFALESRRDGTRDYYLTSLEFVRRITRYVRNQRITTLLGDFAGTSLLHDPYWAHRLLHLAINTWVWQFDATRGRAPMEHQWLVFRARPD